MADTYVQQRIHLVWSTRNGQEFLRKELRERLWSYVGGIIRYNKGVAFAIGGTSDHVHIYCEYSKTTSLAQFVSTIKSNSSKWLRETYPELMLFHWQSGYGAFSVGRKGDDRLTEYIRAAQHGLGLHSAGLRADPLGLATLRAAQPAQS